MRRVLGRMGRGLLRFLPRRMIARLIGGLATYYARALPPDEGLRFLFGLDQQIYHVEGKLAIQYGQGVHTKHRHLQYHDFFVHRVKEGERVLDIGCGSGELAYDLAERAGAVVWGIDMNARSIQTARARHSHLNVTYHQGDALRDLPPKARFDVIILSNVLEHIADRVGLLRRLIGQYQPSRVLIRVPSYERDWRVPLQDELGVDYRLDETHEIEYTQAGLAADLEAAGLAQVKLQPIWGELWVAAVPQAALEHEPSPELAGHQ